VTWTGVIDNKYNLTNQIPELGNLYIGNVIIRNYSFNERNNSVSIWRSDKGVKNSVHLKLKL